MNPQQYPQQPGQPPQAPPPQGSGGLYPPSITPPGTSPSPYGPPAQGSSYPPPGNPTDLSPYPQAPRGPSQPGQSYPQNAPTPGYNPYSFTEEYSLPSPKRGPSKIILLVIGVLAILAILIVILTLSTTGTNTNNQPQNQNPNQNTEESAKDVIPRSDGRLDLSSKISLNDNLKAQTVQGKIKEQVNLSSGFSFMANKIEVYTSPNPTTKPTEGKKFVVITVAVGNRNQKSNLSASYLDFRLRDESNTVVAGHVTTNEILNNPLSNPIELKPGEQTTGKIIFEVDATDTDWVFKHSETYQKTTDNTTFNVEGEIVLQLVTDTSDPGNQNTTPSPTPPSP